MSVPTAALHVPTRPPEPTLAVAGSLASLAPIVAERIVDTLAFRLKDEWVTIAHLAIGGGPAMEAVIEALADGHHKSRLDWEKVHLWWTDERHLGEGHTGRHETHARMAGVARIGIPPDNLHPVPPAQPGEDERPDLAAAAYAASLRRFAPHGRAVPVFDLLLLEVGTRGEVGALLGADDAAGAGSGAPGPSAGSGAPGDAPVLTLWNAPKPFRHRVGLSLPAVKAAARVWLLAAGAERAVAVGRAWGAGEGPDGLPVADVHGVIETAWWLDRSAARAVPPEVHAGRVADA